MRKLTDLNISFKTLKMKIIRSRLKTGKKLAKNVRCSKKAKANTNRK